MAISKEAALTITLGGTALIGALLGGLIGTKSFEERGVSDQYGDNARNNAPFYYRRFVEEHRMVIYMDLSGRDWIIRHAYFKAGANVEAAVDCLRREDNICQAEAIYNNTIHNNLDYFMFSSMQKIFVYIDNDDVSFQNATPISFTPFGANESNSGNPTRSKNYTFYNAGFTKVGSKTDVLVFENHFRDSHGFALDKPGSGTGQQPLSKLSINFNLKRCRANLPTPAPGMPPCDLSDPRQTIPFVYDPDTGNGYGYPPPRLNR